MVIKSFPSPDHEPPPLLPVKNQLHCKKERKLEQFPNIPETTGGVLRKTLVIKAAENRVL